MYLVTVCLCVRQMINTSYQIVSCSFCILGFNLRRPRECASISRSLSPSFMCLCMHLISNEIFRNDEVVCQIKTILPKSSCLPYRKYIFEFKWRVCARVFVAPLCLEVLWCLNSLHCRTMINFMASERARFLVHKSKHQELGNEMQNHHRTRYTHTQIEKPTMQRRRGKKNCYIEPNTENKIYVNEWSVCRCNIEIYTYVERETQRNVCAFCERTSPFNKQSIF